MTPHDGAFGAFAAAHRPRLVTAARLLGAQPDEAERVTHAALARLSEHWPKIDDPVAYAYAAVLGIRGSAPLPWERSVRVTLEDREARTPRAGDVIADLDRLDLEARRAVVLRDAARLGTVDAAAVLGCDGPTLDAAHARGREALAVLGSTWPDIVGSLEPTDLVPPSEQVQRDVAAGRRLRRRRLVRRGVAAGAAVVLVGVGIAQFGPQLRPAPSAPAAAPTTAAPVCDIAEEECRVGLESEWRSETAAVITSHLDPTGRYFDGLSFSPVSDSAAANLWAGRGGSLTVELFSRRGATHVQLQIATSRETAVECGATTKQHCFSQRFQDGNRFSLTDSVDVEEGVEVQHRPAATYVLTAVARNVGKGESLPIGTGDLMKVLQDDRLKLPTT